MSGDSGSITVPKDDPFDDIEDEEYAEAARRGVSERVDPDAEQWRKVEELDLDNETLAQASTPDNALAIREAEKLSENEEAADKDSVSRRESGEPEVTEEEIKYDKKVLDDLSQTLHAVTADNGNAGRFLNDVLTQLGADTEKGEIFEEAGNLGYSGEEAAEYVELMEDANIITDEGQIGERVKPLTKFTTQINNYIGSIEEEIEEIKSAAGEKDKIDNVTVEPSQQHSGRALDTFSENDRVENIADFLDPFDRSASRDQEKDSNKLALLLNAIDEGKSWNIEGETGYSSENSENATLSSLSQEGYLQKEDGSVSANPSGKAIKDATDSIYEQFERIVERETRREKRLEWRAESFKNLKEAYEESKDLDKASQGIVDSEVTDMEDFRDEFKENYSPMARRLSENYDEEFEPEFTEEYLEVRE